jgi:DNA (cytosine-5)-methyltransferase 1
LFTGYGGLDLAVEQVFGGRTAWTSDVDLGACKVIEHRWEHAPNLGDITRIDWSQVEPVDILTGGFPCQDLSMAGRRAGMRSGTRSGLWQHMAYAIDQLRPRYVIAENVRGLLNGTAHSDVEPCPWCLGDRPDGHLRALGAVLGDLAGLGYDAQWCGLRAADVGASHGRFRIFILAADTEYDGRHVGTVGRSTQPGETVGRMLQSERCDPEAATDTDGRRQFEHNPNVRRISEPDPGDRQPVNLLPTPNASVANDGETFETWEERRQRTQERVQNGNGFGTPLSIAVQPEAGMFGRYSDAIARWEPIIGRPAPDPTIGGCLSPLFVEWLMGLPLGWVTDVPGLSRAQQLKALGNGVVPQQATAALQFLNLWADQ